MPYEAFAEAMVASTRTPAGHCMGYYAQPNGNGGLDLIAILADDATAGLRIIGWQAATPGVEVESLVPRAYSLHVFEREISENFGIRFRNSPWDKPFRLAWNRADRSKTLENYPFYRLKGGETHEVGVGPIHAGVIEPGHFRFSCDGEQILQMEIQLGYQHRGVEALMLTKPSWLYRTMLAQQTAGDTAAGHGLAFVSAVEQLMGYNAPLALQTERLIAVELERIAMHTFDLSNLCVGAAYTVGAAVLGALRTPVINYFQIWCGNRFAKALIRVGGTRYPLVTSLKQNLRGMLKTYQSRFHDMAERLFRLPSFLGRVENIGTLTAQQVRDMGFVGQAARASGVPRDLRHTHPHPLYAQLGHQPKTEPTGDVYARAHLRVQEVAQSIDLIYRLLDIHDGCFDEATHPAPLPEASIVLPASSIGIGYAESWRGETVYAITTDAAGHVAHVKVKDPSQHNWFALSLAVRNLEISDFPINNKSFDLSYCGNDL